MSMVQSATAAHTMEHEVKKLENKKTTHATTYDDELLDHLSDMDEQCIVEEARVMSTKEVQTQEISTEPPALPQRSSLRASRLLDNLRLSSIKSVTDSISVPHDIYLSSEEDASSSADDLSGDDFEADDDEMFDADDSESSSEELPRRESREDTARAVSVVFVGKPSIVELSPGRKSVSPVPSLNRPQTSFFGHVSVTQMEARPRQASLSNTVKRKPAFLNTDPFAGSNYLYDSKREESQDTPVTPKTPTAVLNRFQKSLGLVRKRSRPHLKAAAAASRESLAMLPASASALNLLNTMSPTLDERAATPAPYQPTTLHKHSRTETFSSQPKTQMSPAPTRKSILSGLNLKRRQSMRV